MKCFALSLGLLLILSGCRTVVRPHYVVRHSERGSSADIKEFLVAQPRFGLLATGAGALGGGVLALISANDAGALPAGLLVGGLFGLSIDGVLAATGYYSGPAVIYECKHLKASHRVTTIPQRDLAEMLKALKCKRVGVRF